MSDPHVPRRRAVAGVPRTRQLVVRFSPDEWRQVAAAAEADGRAVGAWVGELACQIAAGGTSDFPGSWADVIRHVVRKRAEFTRLVAALRESHADDRAAELVEAVGIVILRLDELLERVLSTGSV
jgi:hypothetical protein